MLFTEIGNFLILPRLVSACGGWSESQSLFSSSAKNVWFPFMAITNVSVGFGSVDVLNIQYDAGTRYGAQYTQLSSLQMTTKWVKFRGFAGINVW